MNPQNVVWTEGHSQEALVKTAEGERIYVHNRNRLEILRRKNAHMYVSTEGSSLET